MSKHDETPAEEMDRIRSKRIAELEAELAAKRIDLASERLAHEAERARTDALVDALVNNKSQGLIGELIAEVRKDRLRARK